jgi:hypothetical protein
MQQTGSTAPTSQRLRDAMKHVFSIPHEFFLANLFLSSILTFDHFTILSGG